MPSAHGAATLALTSSRYLAPVVVAIACIVRRVLSRVIAGIVAGLLRVFRVIVVDLLAVVPAGLFVALAGAAAALKGLFAGLPARVP